jgi:F-type H+-transporting ATPase subunit a
MNMIAGHILLALCFTATSFFFVTALANGNLLGRTLKRLICQMF